MTEKTWKWLEEEIRNGMTFEDILSYEKTQVRYLILIYNLLFAPGIIVGIIFKDLVPFLIVYLWFLGYFGIAGLVYLKKSKNEAKEDLVRFQQGTKKLKKELMETYIRNVSDFVLDKKNFGKHFLKLKKEVEEWKSGRFAKYKTEDVRWIEFSEQLMDYAEKKLSAGEILSTNERFKVRGSKNMFNLWGDTSTGEIFSILDFSEKFEEMAEYINAYSDWTKSGLVASYENNDLLIKKVSK